MRYITFRDSTIECYYKHNIYLGHDVVFKMIHLVNICMYDLCAEQPLVRLRSIDHYTDIKDFSREKIEGECLNNLGNNCVHVT